MHAASLMDDDGNVEIRTRLIRPMTRETISVERFNHSHWRKATREEFSALWEAECARVPEFSESAFHIITGLLLPIWDRLPAQNMRVYRFETDDGERVIGRLVTPEALDRVYEGLGVDGAPALSHRRSLERRHRSRRGARSCRRAADPPLAGDEHASRRADRLHRWRGPAAEGARPHLGNHRLAPAALRADRRAIAARHCSQHSSTATRSSAPIPAPPPDREMRRDQRSAGDLARRLARDAEAVCRHYLSNGRRRAITGLSATS